MYKEYMRPDGRIERRHHNGIRLRGVRDVAIAPKIECDEETEARLDRQALRDLAGEYPTVYGDSLEKEERRFCPACDAYVGDDMGEYRLCDACEGEERDALDEVQMEQELRSGG
jgi:hypothetical protein